MEQQRYSRLKFDRGLKDTEITLKFGILKERIVIL